MTVNMPVHTSGGQLRPEVSILRMSSLIKVTARIRSKAAVNFPAMMKLLIIYGVLFFNQMAILFLFGGGGCDIQWHNVGPWPP